MNGIIILHPMGELLFLMRLERMAMSQHSQLPFCQPGLHGNLIVAVEKLSICPKYLNIRDT